MKEVDKKEEATKIVSILVIDELCPEEAVFLDSILESKKVSRSTPGNLEFGLDGSGLLLSTFIIEAVKCAIIELWSIAKPAVSEIVTAGVQNTKDRVISLIVTDESGATKKISERDYERILAAAKRSAIKNGCSDEQANKISQSVGRSIKSSKGQA